MELHTNARRWLPPALLASAGVAAAWAARTHVGLRRCLHRERETRASAERRKDELIATISHELRTPLTSIHGWIELLRRGDLDPETRALALESIEESTRSQKLLIDDLLDSTRIALGKLDLAREPIALGSVLREAARGIDPLAAAKAVALRFESPSTPLLVLGDRQRLKQVASNLLSNALKFTPRDGAITLSLERDASRARITVSDTGAGIDPAVLPHLFERFSQGRAGASKGGLGLGLAICHTIVEEHGGTITLHSEGPGCGTTATVTLPGYEDRRPV